MTKNGEGRYYNRIDYLVGYSILISDLHSDIIQVYIDISMRIDYIIYLFMSVYLHVCIYIYSHVHI